MTDPIPSTRGIRWRAALVLLTVAALFLAGVWLWPDLPRQRRVMNTMITGASLAVLLLLWLWFRSGMRKKTAGLITAGLALLAGVGAALVKVDGVNGDLVAILRWRWADRPAEVAGQAGDAEALAALPVAKPFPQFLGPSRDCLITGAGLAPDWKAKQPRLLWRKAAGESVAGIAISGRHTLTVEQDAGHEALVSRDLLTGAELWRTTWPGRYDNALARVGPRTTPCIRDGRVFATGSLGELVCAALDSGTVHWRINFLDKTGGEIPQWGASASPLVSPDGSVVIVTGGGKGHAISAWKTTDGSLAWAGGEEGAGYSSPQWVTLGGAEQILSFNGDGVAGYEPGTGRRLWLQPWPAGTQRVSDPRVTGPDTFLASAGYGAGCDLVKVARSADGTWSAVVEWHSQRLKSKYASIALHPDGQLLGIDDGTLCSIDLQTGDRFWKGERCGHGQLLVADGRLIVMAENGEVLYLLPQRDGAVELGRITALEDQTWNPHALSGRFLAVRNSREIACWLLP